MLEISRAMQSLCPNTVQVQCASSTRALCSQTTALVLSNVNTGSSRRSRRGCSRRWMRRFLGVNRYVQQAILYRLFPISEHCPKQGTRPHCIVRHDRTARIQEGRPMCSSGGGCLVRWSQHSVSWLPQCGAFREGNENRLGHSPRDSWGAAAAMADAWHSGTDG